jgi:hypothetical protein
MARHTLSPSMAGTLAVMGLDGAELDALGQAVDTRGGAYEPPEFDVDPKWGITKTERLMLITGGIVLTGAAVALLVRSRMQPNRRRTGPRKNRLRVWGSK